MITISSGITVVRRVFETNLALQLLSFSPYASDRIIHVFQPKHNFFYIRKDPCSDPCIEAQYIFNREEV